MRLSARYWGILKVMPKTTELLNNSKAFTKSVNELKKVAVTSSRYKPEARALVEQTVTKLRSLDIEVVSDFDGDEDLAALELDMVMCFGGDGTLLATARRLANSQTPTLGINFGKLGFLAEHSIAELESYLEGEVPTAWEVTPKMMLQLSIERNGKTKNYYGMNDVMLSQGVMTRLLNIVMSVDDQHATHYRADGIVVSTPVGSTAYSLSLGGPILTQGLRAFVITPIAPHVLTNRPIVIEGSSVATFVVSGKAGEIALVLDGQERIDIEIGQSFSIQAAPKDFMLISNNKRNYYDILREKLGWGEQPKLKSYNIEQDANSQSANSQDTSSKIAQVPQKTKE